MLVNLEKKKALTFHEIIFTQNVQEIKKNSNKKLKRKPDKH